jgi:hypothetical protein
MPLPFYAKPSLHLEIYDALTSAGWGKTSADVSFFCQEFQVLVQVLERINDLVSQCLTEAWRFTEFGSDNVRVVREEEEILKVRWTFRQEMRHLLRLCEFRVLAEYSDFEKSPPSCGKEQVWVAAKNG